MGKTKEIRKMNVDVLLDKIEEYAILMECLAGDKSKEAEKERMYYKMLLDEEERRRKTC